jgi:sugar O-acyltransferase (sialic acid O-acetyltransferase NeuD family)
MEGGEMNTETSVAGSKLVIVGAGAFAEVACEYFTHDSPNDVVAFAVEEEFLDDEELLGRPVVPFETVNERYDPEEFDAFVAVTYTRCNMLRERLCEEAKSKGYSLASYVSSNAFVWQNVEIGENCFIFEDNVVQPFVKLGNNVILWSGNHIGHHSTIGDHCFLASHVVVSGFVNIGRNCFLGVNATVADGLRIGDYSLVGADATILNGTGEYQVLGAEQTGTKSFTSFEYYGVDK